MSFPLNAAFNKPRHSFLALDGLRGVAALCVMVHHYCLDLGIKWQPNAYLAVDFFFVLSGFVIAHAYESRLTEGWPLRSFMRVRLIRLWPLYIVGLTLSLTNILLQSAFRSTAKRLYQFYYILRIRDIFRTNT